mmetsp:Transcript_10164/g.19708  ORF Transcript_10164/g.19708 Transcript_10164/m.19708 type:complete len:232 (-) Transcript_10164:362-1057(-)
MPPHIALVCIQLIRETFDFLFMSFLILDQLGGQELEVLFLVPLLVSLHLLPLHLFATPRHLASHHILFTLCVQMISDQASGRILTTRVGTGNRNVIAHGQVLHHGLEDHVLFAVITRNEAVGAVCLVLGDFRTTSSLLTSLESTLLLVLLAFLVEVLFQLFLCTLEHTTVRVVETLPFHILYPAPDVHMRCVHRVNVSPALRASLVSVKDTLQTGTAEDMPCLAVRLHNIF